MRRGQTLIDGLRKESHVLTVANLRIFEALARLASFSRAAEELAVSQPYVPAQISSLEARLGIELFRRVGRRAYFTETGRLLYSHAVRILVEVTEAERSLAEVRGVVAGPLAIAATATPAASIVPNCLEKLLADHPDVAVSLQIFGSPEVERAVLEGRCDLGVLVSEPRTNGFTVDAIGTDELMVVVSPSHPLASRDGATPEELQKELFLTREPSSGTRRFIELRFGETGVRLRYGAELNSNEAIKAFVASGLGISILSRQAVHFELLAGHLAALRVEGLPLVRTLCLIACAGAKLGPAARALRAVMLAAAADSPGVGRNDGVNARLEEE